MTSDDLVDQVQLQYWRLIQVMDLDDCPLLPTADHIQNYLNINLDQVFVRTQENPPMWTLPRLFSARTST